MSKKKKRKVNVVILKWPLSHSGGTRTDRGHGRNSFDLIGVPTIYDQTLLKPTHVACECV